VNRLATKIIRLLSGPLPTFPENFMQIRSEVLAQSIATLVRRALAEVSL